MKVAHRARSIQEFLLSTWWERRECWTLSTTQPFEPAAIAGVSASGQRNRSLAGGRLGMSRSPQQVRLKPSTTCVGHKRGSPNNDVKTSAVLARPPPFRPTDRTFGGYRVPFARCSHTGGHVRHLAVAHIHLINLPIIRYSSCPFHFSIRFVNAAMASPSQPCRTPAVPVLL